jgi:hypothetical protein
MTTFEELSQAKIDCGWSDEQWTGLLMKLRERHGSKPKDIIAANRAQASGKKKATTQHSVNKTSEYSQMKVASTTTFSEQNNNCDTVHTFSGDIPAQTAREQSGNRNKKIEVPIINVNVLQPERIVQTARDGVRPTRARRGISDAGNA